MSQRKYKLYVGKNKLSPASLEDPFYRMEQIL